MFGSIVCCFTRQQQLHVFAISHGTEIQDAEHSNPFGMRITCKLWLDLNVWHLLFSGYPSIAHRTFKCRPGFMRLPHQRHPVCRARCLRYVRCDRP